ncbi:hypothetical protein DFH07DRAFT_962312 [Mycena maculata]|uniref:RING-type domain-containing protein n=1 Tax=Mycena maculata TaxID=230809 RepID=A0AAD7N5V2_9AGAR|nr:hypothetical protein DFH07DRAFT_962312 [Mycena maculata]
MYHRPRPYPARGTPARFAGSRRVADTTVRALAPALDIIRGPPSTVVPPGRTTSNAREVEVLHGLVTVDLTARIEAIQARISQIDREMSQEQLGAAGNTTRAARPAARGNSAPSTRGAASPTGAVRSPAVQTAASPAILTTGSTMGHASTARTTSNTERLTPADVLAVRREQARQDHVIKSEVGAALYGRPLGVPLRCKKPVNRSGSRMLRETPLTRSQLWLDDKVPPVQHPKEDHHMCGICLMAKSHPVSNVCGHSYCYVCIRVQLETDWKCPNCKTEIYWAPFQHCAEEKFLRHTRKRDAVDAGYGDDSGDERTLVADIGIYLSGDGRQRQEEMLNVSHKKRRVQPSDLADSYGEWVPVPENQDHELLDEGTTNLLDRVASEPGRKRKDYASSDDPMSLWRPLKGLFGDELVHHNGLGDDCAVPCCALCKAPYMQGLCLTRHELTPLHVVEEWNSQFWAETSLQELGLVYQLGHGGFPCVFPDQRIYKMTVIEAPVIHQIRVRYCKCSKSDDADNLSQLLRNAWYPATVTDPATCAMFKTLEAYRLYNVVGNMNVHDFVRAMEQMTDGTATTGMKWLPDRYKQLQRMTRQWAFLKRIKRAGRFHDAAGVDATELRECAVKCWACPQDSRNLPPNWRDVDPAFRFLYMLLLAVDANFKLKNRMRANKVDDPPLGPGWSYWVEPQRYKQHLKKYVAEKDMSTCIVFAALLQKNTRMTTGLRASGVGGCVCARHECVRPNGIGDLQKGERYSNMDYIVLSALAGFTLLLLTISYDIACQWKKTLPERNATMPKEIRLNLDSFTYQCALPVWHAGSHNEDCATQNSLSFKPGVGKSDGEGVERVWAVLNLAAYHTKDAGRGQRVDSIEDKIDSHNFLKNIGQGDSLQRKLIVAIAERDRQVMAFKEISRTIEKDPNPYTMSRQDCPTEAEVRLEVKRDEDAAVAAGRAPLPGSSATAFLIAGLQIEEAQRRILVQLAGTSMVTADQEEKLHDWRRALLVKIGKFRELQNRYMPGAAQVILDTESERDEDAAPPKPEKIKLWMPSQMPAREGDPLRGCAKGLIAMETKLRASQCSNAMVGLRARLHAKRHLISFRNANVSGQIQSTKARTLIDKVGERVEASAEKYRHARRALISLNPASTVAFRELRPEDIQLDGDAGESDAAARKKLAMISAGHGRRGMLRAHQSGSCPGFGLRQVPWTTKKSIYMNVTVRVEWARARTRKVRWEEEVHTLREEMRRVLRYLEWQSAWWRARVESRPDVAAEVAAGVRAYAFKQADLHDRLRVFFQTKWKMPVIEAARRVVALEEAVLEEGTDLNELFGSVMY